MSVSFRAVHSEAFFPLTPAKGGLRAAAPSPPGGRCAAPAPGRPVPGQLPPAAPSPGDPGGPAAAHNGRPRPARPPPAAASPCCRRRFAGAIQLRPIAIAADGLDLTAPLLRGAGGGGSRPPRSPPRRKCHPGRPPALPRHMLRVPRLRREREKPPRRNKAEEASGGGAAGPGSGSRSAQAGGGSGGLPGPPGRAAPTRRSMLHRRAGKEPPAPPFPHLPAAPPARPAAAVSSPSPAPPRRPRRRPPLPRPGGAELRGDGRGPRAGGGTCRRSPPPARPPPRPASHVARGGRARRSAVRKAGCPAAPTGRSPRLQSCLRAGGASKRRGRGEPAPRGSHPRWSPGRPPRSPHRARPRRGVLPLLGRGERAVRLFSSVFDLVAQGGKLVVSALEPCCFRGCRFSCVPGRSILTSFISFFNFHSCLFKD